MVREIWRKVSAGNVVGNGMFGREFTCCITFKEKWSKEWWCMVQRIKLTSFVPCYSVFNMHCTEKVMTALSFELATFRLALGV